MKRVYLAGPDVFYADAKERGAKLQKLCTKFDFEGVYPLDGQLHIPLSKLMTGEVIYSKNIRLIQSCDILLANMTPFRGPSMDVGTAYEMGHASGLGKTVVGYTTERSYKDRVHPDAHLVEDFDMVDNLMVHVAAWPIFSTPEDALAFLADALATTVD